MQQKSFYVEHFHQIEGPVKGRKLLDQYFRGEIHDDTLIWDTGTRHWFRFIELKAFLYSVQAVLPVVPHRRCTKIEAAAKRAVVKSRCGGETQKGRSTSKLKSRMRTNQTKRPSEATIRRKARSLGCRLMKVRARSRDSAEHGPYTVIENCTNAVSVSGLTMAEANRWLDNYAKLGEEAVPPSRFRL